MCDRVKRTRHSFTALPLQRRFNAASKPLIHRRFKFPPYVSRSRLGLPRANSFLLIYFPFFVGKDEFLLGALLIN